MYGSFILAPFPNSDVENDIKRLETSKSVRFDDILSFVTKGCIEILVFVLEFVFNLGLSQNAWPNLRKQAPTVPVLKKADVPVLVIKGP
jgi:hypothetical protein